MRKLSGREKFLAAVLVVGGGWLLLKFGGGGLGGSGSGLEGTGELVALGVPPEVDIDLLNTEIELFDPKGRDLFKYYVPPPTRVAPPPRPPPRVTPPRPQPPPTRRVTTKPVPRPPQPDFAYLGFLGPQEDRIAVFDGGKGELMLARVGDTVADEFNVQEFQYEKILLGFTDRKWTGRTAELEMKEK